MAHEPAEPRATELSEDDKQTVADSPLNEAADGGASIQALFDRDPLDITDKELDAVAAHMRQTRHAWEQEDIKGNKKKSAKAKAAAKPKPKATPGLSLDDLGI